MCLCDSDQGSGREAADWLEEGSTGFPRAHGKPGNVREFDWFSRPGKVTEMNKMLKVKEI